MKKFLLVLTVCLFTVGAFAQEAKFDPYVSIRAFYGYHHNDLPTGSTVADNETDQTYRLNASSRFGSMFASGNVKGVFEMGLQAHATSSTPVNYVYLRLLNATYDFGFMKLTVGQDYTPYTWIPGFIDEIDDNCFGGFGATYDGRTPLIKLDVMGAYIAAIAPSRTLGSTSAYNAANVVSAADTTAILPKLAIGYDYKAEGIIVGAGFAYNSVKINDSSKAASYDGKKINSWLGYVHGDASVSIISLKANFGFGQNLGNFGEVLGPIAGTSNIPDTLAGTSTFVKNSAYVYYDTTAQSIKNSTHFEGYVNVIVKLDPMLWISGGVGYQQDKVDATNYSTGEKAKADKQICYALEARVAVDKNLTFVPMWTYRDYMKDADGDKQGKEYYAGVKIQFDVK